MLYLSPLTRLTSLLFTAVILIAITTAQTILPSTASASFPACALSCSQLIQAQSGCIPPVAPVTDQYFYDTCFCQSPLLSQLHTSPDGTCDTYCTAESDRQLLQSWYNGFCASQTASTGSTSSATSSAIPPPVSTVTSGVSTVIVILPATSAASSSVSPAATGSGSTVGSTRSSSNSWIDTHWRWILMLGILLVGLGLIALIAVYLKRRHHRKLNEKRASLSGFPPAPSAGRGRTPTPTPGPELWGPHQHMAHTRGWEYNHEQGDTSASGGVLGPGKKKSKKGRGDRGEKGSSRNKGSVRDADSNAPSVLTEMSKIQQKNEWEQQQERQKTRDQYAEYRTQSMRGAVSAFERDKDNLTRSQTMRERDRISWQDPEKRDTIEKM